MKPEVSVVIPTYNSEPYIAQALESVLNQSFRNFEILLIDDASTDGTIRVAEQFNDARLKIIRNRKNRGVSYSRNLGIKMSQGPWIALLDSDDWYASERLEKLLAIADVCHGDLIADDLLFIRDEQCQPWSTLLSEDPHQNGAYLTLIDAVTFVQSDRLKPINAQRNWSLGYTKPLMKKEFLLKNNIWYDEKLKVGEDFTLYLECLRHQAKFYLLDQAYYYYRTRSNSLSIRKTTEFLIQSCDITQRFINREVSVTLESSLLQALSKNLRVFEQRLEYYIAIENFREKRWLQAIQHLWVHPSVLVDLCQKLLTLSQRKLVLATKNNLSPAWIYIHSK